MQRVWKIGCVLLIIMGLPAYGASSETGATEEAKLYVLSGPRFTHYDLALIEQILNERCSRAKEEFPKAAAVIDTVYKEKIAAAQATAAKYKLESKKDCI